MTVTPVPVTRAPMIFSASRIGTWIACNRKAAWEYLAGYRSPETPATARGQAVHAVLEQAVPAMIAGQTEVLDLTDEIHEIAAQILPHIPPEILAPGVQFEGQFALRGRHLWTGYKDLRNAGRVVDYKTTSDFRYAKTPEALANDPQALLYAESEFSEAAERGAELDAVQLRWIYSRTRKPFQARPVDLTVMRTHAALGFAALETFADEMQAASDACPTDPVEQHRYILASVRANTALDQDGQNACDAYGGCPHRARCNIPMFRDTSDPMYTEKTHMNILERLQATTALNGGPANTTAAPRAVPVAPPALLPAGPPGTPNPLYTRLAAEMGAPAPGGNPHPMSARTDLPPDAPDAPAIDLGINPPKRGPGRPRKNADTIPVQPSAAIVAAAAALPAPVAVPVPVTPAPVPAPAPIPVPEQRLIGTLYVGCMPSMAATELDELLLKARAMIGDAAYFGGFGYKTNGLMSEAVARLVSAGTFARLVVRSPNAPEAALVLSYLRANATEVVEALR